MSGCRPTSRTGLRRILALILAALLLAGCVDAGPVESSEPSPDPDASTRTQPATPDRSEPDSAASEDLDPDTRPSPPGADALGPGSDPPPPPPPAGREELVAHLGEVQRAAVAAAGSASLAVLVVDEHGRTLVSHAPDLPLLPASTMKNVTAAAVLSTLGPEARFQTVVEATAPVDGDGVLDGDLVLIGSGDPVLATEEYGRWVYPARPRTPLESLAEDLVAHGLVRITGDVIGDPGPFGGEPHAAGWPDRYFASFDARSIAGLTVDAGLVTLMRYPELEAALEAAFAEELQDEAPDGGLALLDESGPDVEELNALEPEQLALALGLEGPGAPDVRVEHAPDPTAHAAEEFVRLLEQRGVVVEGSARAGEATEPVMARLASVSSPPVEELLRFALKHSDNHLSDQLFQAIGRVRTGEGSWERGERAVRQVLDRFGIDHDGARFADGSGLSRDDRLTVRQLVELDRAMTASRHGELWTSLMAVMGEDGTLRQRLRSTPARGRFVGKTGTLDDVTALAGAVVGDDGGRYHLAVIANDAVGQGRWVARALMDEIVLALVADLESCELLAAEASGTEPLGRPLSVVAC